MYTVPGCKINQKVYESSASLIFRGTREVDSLPVILKILKDDYPSPEELVRFRQEYEITQNLNLDGVIKTFGQEKYRNSLAIILEDFGGESLRILGEKHKFSLLEVLKLGMRISNILGELHGAQVIHKDINPSNIVYNPESEQLKIIDFGLSTLLSYEMPELKVPEKMAGTLAYMSPEQTGRMNRVLDYRTDYYALGVTLYELCTGTLPFPTQDALELTHCHLAREPRPPHEINVNIPEGLSQVLLKLLAKRAEDRYQTAQSLSVDLEFCLSLLEGKTASLPFTPGEKDVSTRFQLPQELYGREAERDTLLNTAGRAAMGRSEALFVAGYSGVGKSALIKEVCRKLIRPGSVSGYFVFGKFDQYQRDIPYSAAQSALRNLIRQLLMESKERLARWKEYFKAALGPNGRLMIDIVPELELIIGPCPPAAKLESTAHHNRFKLVLRNFVNVFLKPEHPLVLFLDDLQWADLASLELIKLITLESNHLFFIGAYRDNEVSTHHPLLLTVDEIRIKETPVHTIHLAPLELKDIQRYVAAATRVTPDETNELSRLLLHKTAGNPFFLGEFLKTMVREKLLVFQEAEARWVWDMGRVQEQQISDNVVELISEQVDRLPADTKAALTRAACLGNSFDLGTLALIHEKSPAKTAQDLWPALELNMILPLHDRYKIAALEPLDINVPGPKSKVVYRFAHDLIAEAGYSLLSEHLRQSLHLKVGRLLLDKTFGADRAQRLFEIVDHLNRGRELILETGERYRLARWNLQVGGGSGHAGGQYWENGKLRGESAGACNEHHRRRQNL